MTTTGDRHPADRPPRLSVARFSEEVVDEVFSTDRGLPWTLWQMTRRPGATLRRYVDWRDPRVTRPVRYYLVALTIAGLSLWWGNSAAQFASGFAAGLAEGSTEGLATGGKPSPFLAVLLDVLAQPAVLLALTFVPSLAAAIERGYRRSDVNFAEAFAMSLYITAHASLLFALGTTVLEAVGLDPNANAMIVLPLALVVYPACALHGAFERDGAGRALAAVGLAFALAMLLTVTVAFGRMSLGY